MKRNVSLVMTGFAILAAAMSVSSPTGAAERKIVRVAGATTVLPAVSKAAEEYKAVAPDVIVTVSAGGSGVGIRNAASGLAEIGMASRDVGEGEKKLFGAKGIKVTVIGRDAVAAVVSRAVWDGGVHALTLAQIRQIYAGEVTDWQAVGGAAGKILVVDKESSRGTRHVFMAAVFGDEMAKAAGAKIITGDNNEDYGAVARSKGAIGPLSFAWADDKVKAVAIRTPKGDVAATLGSIRDGTYPISRDLLLVTTAQPTPEAEAFIAFMLGPIGQRIVKDSGYVTVR